MSELNLNNGTKELSINGKVTVSFCPTDVAFVKKIVDVFEKCDIAQEKFRKNATAKDGYAEFFDAAQQLNKELRDLINQIFDKDICTPVFGDISLIAFADGLPLWANLLLALIDELDASFEEEKAQLNPRIKKYAEKYRK